MKPFEDIEPKTYVIRDNWELTGEMEVTGFTDKQERKLNLSLGSDKAERVLPRSIKVQPELREIPQREVIEIFTDGLFPPRTVMKMVRFFPLDDRPFNPLTPISLTEQSRWFRESEQVTETDKARFIDWFQEKMTGLFHHLNDGKRLPKWAISTIWKPVLEPAEIVGPDAELKSLPGKITVLGEDVVL